MGLISKAKGVASKAKGVVSNLFSDDAVELIVVTDNDKVCAGGIVAGRIVAVFKKPPAAAARLMLEFYGNERTRCKWTETFYSQDNRLQSTTTSTGQDRDHSTDEAHRFFDYNSLPGKADGGGDGGAEYASYISCEGTSSHPVVSVEWVLADHLADCAPGSYEYPFSFRLPADLASSLCEHKHDGPP